MGNEVSRPAGTDNLSPQNSGVVPQRTPSTPTGGASRRAQSFNARSPPPSLASNPPPAQRRTSSSSSLGSNASSNPNANPKRERTIQRMDKAIRRRVRGGITYNMKLLIRGAKGTGKTSLFQRLKGEPIPETHQSTPQLQSATINWSFRQNLEENVKCEVWDVVDRGFVPVEAQYGAEEGAAGSQKAATGVSASRMEQGGLHSRRSLSAEATAAAAAAAAVMQNGTHSVAIVDASTVDVYHEAHGVIFLLDVTKWDTLEYVKQQLDNVPVHIPTLVLGNFRDQGAQRKIFKEDIQELLYGSSDRPQQQQWRRPMELLYFECSLLNCYGLKSLHQYFGIPFLQLKLATIRQQMRIVEGEFAHLKHDVQATITEQRYAGYVEHIKTTGSDIRTGRRGSGTPPAVSRYNPDSLSPKVSSQTKPTTQQEGADDDVSVVSKENGAGTPPQQAAAVTTTATVATETSQQEQEAAQSQDMEDLPARNSSAVIQAAPPLMFEHKESVASISDDIAEEKENVSKFEDKPALPEGQSSKAPVVSNASPSRPRKASMEEVIHLEDFQVPKTRTSDLDHFYSEDESDDDAGDNDEDVVVARVDGSMKASISGVYHKQRFLDSDSSDSDESETAGTQRRRKEKATRTSSSQRKATKQANTTDQTVRRPPQSSPSPHPPTSASRPKQKSRPGSPARSQPSSPVKDYQDAPREVSSKQRQSSGPTSGVAGSITPIPPAAPPTSPSASSIRHSSPRNKSENSVVVTNPESRVSVSQDENELKHESSSGEEPELTGTEESISPSGQESPKSSSKQESLKTSIDGTYATANGANGDTVIDTYTPHVTENKELSVSVTPIHDAPRQDTSSATDNGVNSKPEDAVRVPTSDQTYNSVEKEIEGGSVDAEMDGLNVGLVASSHELNTFLENGEEEEENDDNAPAAPQAVEKTELPQYSTALSSSHRRPEVLMSDNDSDGDTGDKNGPTKMSLSSLQESLPLPESSASSSIPSVVPVLSTSVGIQSAASEGPEETMGHFHKRNLDQAGDLLSLSALQASLPLPKEATVPLPSTLHESTELPMEYSNGANDSRTNAALHLSDLQTISSQDLASKPVVPDFATVVPSNDLDAFLNESDSDSEDASPPSCANPAGGNKQLTKQRQINKRAMVESSDDDEDEEDDQGRFASYSISKKKRSERRRQQKEDLRQLNAALGTEKDPFTPSASAVAATDSSFGTSDVMEAIRKAQEEAMRMLPTEPASANVHADSSSSKKRHTHKHKKEHKKKEGDDDKLSKKSSRKSGSSSCSKKRRPQVEEDLA